MKLTKLVLISLMLYASMLYAQKVEEAAQPVGGIAAIVKNVQYPEAARSEGIQGKVLIKAVIGTDGNVVSTKVEKGIDKLNEAAVAAVKATKFNPAKMDGKAVKAEVTIPISFKLNDCKEEE